MVMSSGKTGFVIENAASIKNLCIVHDTRLGDADAGRIAFRRHWRQVDARSRHGSCIVSILDLQGIAAEASGCPHKPHREDAA